MSGGSYNYLDGFARDGLFTESQMFGELERMAERLTGLDWAKPAARDTRAVIDRARALDADLTALADVFHAIEWWDSCDWSEADARGDVECYESRWDCGCFHLPRHDPGCELFTPTGQRCRHCHLTLSEHTQGETDVHCPPATTWEPGP